MPTRYQIDLSANEDAETRNRWEAAMFPIDDDERSGDCVGVGTGSTISEAVDDLLRLTITPSPAPRRGSEGNVRVPGRASLEKGPAEC